MKYISKILALCLSTTILFSEGKALLRPAPGQFGLQGELLFLKATTDQSDFVMTDVDADGEATGERINNIPGYRPGFRLEGMYALNCLADVRAMFTYFNHGHTTRASGLISDIQSWPFFESSGLPGTASSKLERKYYAGDLLCGARFFQSCPFNLTLLAGAHYTYMRANENISINTPTSPNIVSKLLEQQSRFWGVGPEVGLDFQFRPACFCGFSLVANARGSLLVSNSKCKYEQLATSATPLIFNNLQHPQWRTTSAFDARLGVNWEVQWSCFGTSVEVGYEMINYRNAIYKHYPTPTLAGGTSTTIHSFNLYGDASFHGPYLAIGAIF